MYTLLIQHLLTSYGMRRHELVQLAQKPLITLSDKEDRGSVVLKSIFIVWKLEEVGRPHSAPKQRAVMTYST